MKKAVAALALLVSSPAFAADQFDLICSGTTHSGGSEYPFTAEYQIDLKAARYCTVGACVEPRPIASATDVYINFEDRVATRDRASELTRVNRATGGFFSKLGPTRTSSELWTSGSCSLAAFKPFPAVKQLF